MRQGANKRSRGRSGHNKPHMPQRMQTFDSSGPDVRIRGSAWQVHERYLNMARDAMMVGDRVAAERQGWDIYYDALDALEMALRGPSPPARALRSAASAILAGSRVA